MSTSDSRRNDGRAIQLAEADVNIVDSRTKLRGSRKNPPKSEIGTFHQPIGMCLGVVGEVYGEFYGMG
jgi:hypothetical protein